MQRVVRLREKRSFDDELLGENPEVARLIYTDNAGLVDAQEEAELFTQPPSSAQHSFELEPDQLDEAEVENEDDFDGEEAGDGGRRSRRADTGKRRLVTKRRL